MGLYAQMQAALYEEEGSATEVLSVVRRSMLDAARLDPACGEMLETLEACLVQVEELHQGLARRADRIEDNPARLAWVNDRLSDLQSLQRKYRVESAADLANLLRTLRQELDALEHLEEDAEALDQRIAALYQTLQAHAQELSQNRQQAALKLDAAIQRELRELGMEKAIFATEIQVNAAEITALGTDRVEFLLSVNPGQAPRPLARVASGGELSRVMLAIQTILTSDTVETLIFDEVDTGISGRVAEIVGLKLASLGKRQQTLCITHLPQIAAFSQQHYAVSKSVVDDKTFTAIQQLSAQEAIQELARLMGGTEITPQTLKLAREMRKRSQQKLSAEPN
jgi:DNA repair protein RecN (Recombination protein N)